MDYVQGAPPEWMHVVLGGDTRPGKFLVSHYIAFFRKIKNDIEEASILMLPGFTLGFCLFLMGRGVRFRAGSKISALRCFWGSSVRPKENDDDQGLETPSSFLSLEFLFSSSIAAVSPKVTFFRVILNTLFKGHKYLCGRSLNEVVQHQRSPFSG